MLAIAVFQCVHITELPFLQCFAENELLLFENIPFFCNPCNFSSFFGHPTLFSSSLKWYSSFYRFFEDDDVMTLTTVVLLLQQNYFLSDFQLVNQMYIPKSIVSSMYSQNLSLRSALKSNAE